MPSSLYWQWNQALAKYFYNAPHANLPVYLQVDSEMLQQINRNWSSAVDPEKEFINSVRDVWQVTKYQKDPPFRTISLNANRWWADIKTTPEKPPPFIGLLGISVLAATKMASDPKQGIDIKNYYVHLNELLGRRDMGQPNGFDELAEFWEELNQWLQLNRNQLGRPTARTHDTFRHIGYPISQCLLRSGDRGKLTDFFLWERLDPGDEVTAKELASRLVIWSSRTTCTLSSQGRTLLQSDNQQLIEQVAEIALAEFAQWQGEARDSEGPNTAPIAIRLEEPQRGGRLFHCNLYPRAPQGFPEGYYSFDHQRYQLTYLNGSDYFNSLPDNLTEQAFSKGIALEKAPYKVSLMARDIILFRLTDKYPGGWISQARVTWGERHIILCREILANEVESFLANYSDEGWKRAPGTKGLPENWCCFLNVIITKPVPEREDILSCLIPRQNIGIKFVGGLQTDHNSWLVASPPKVLIKVDATESLPVYLNDQEILCTTNGAAHINLANLDLDVGIHSLQIANYSRTFRLHLSGEGSTRQHNTALLGYSFAQSTTEYRPILEYPEWFTSISLLPSETVIVVGAKLHAHPRNLPQPLDEIIALPPGYKRYILLGRVPGQIVEFKYTDLDDQYYVPTNFEPQWLVTTGSKQRKQLIPQRSPQLPELSGEEIFDSRAISEWIRWTKKRLRLSKRNEIYQAVWDAYRNLALRLEE